jgi:hypothetical protein
MTPTKGPGGFGPSPGRPCCTRSGSTGGWTGRPGRLAAIHQARTALRAGGVPCAPPVPTRDGAPWISLKGRLVEVEPYVDHDAKLDTWERLATGMPLLARAHNLLAPLEVGEAGRRPRFANHLEPAAVSSAVRRGTDRIRA